MNKTKLVEYINDTYNKNKHIYTYKYFKIIKNIINEINIDNTLTIKALINNTTVFTQEIDLGKYGIYHIDFNIPKILNSLQNEELVVKRIKSSDINFKLIYHEYPHDYNKNIMYNSKILITDLITDICFYTVIDGNHTLEQQKQNNNIFDVYYLPFDQIPRICYSNDFSYFFHYLINEFYIIFLRYHKDKKMQKRLIKSSKIYDMFFEFKQNK